MAYKAEHGNCNVKHDWAEDLAKWVSQQRRLKRKIDRGEHSIVLTARRAARLTALGFVWGQWEAQLAVLATYKAAHGACNVPPG